MSGAINPEVGSPSRRTASARLSLGWAICSTRTTKRMQRRGRATALMLMADGRARYEAGAKLMTCLVDIALQKHEIVNVVLIPGNHDEDASVCLRVALSLFYVQIHASQSTRSRATLVMRFGKCLLGANHGHTMRPERMAMMLATDCARDWGDTDHKHMFFGHVHHESAKSVGPVRVESFQEIPAPKDAYDAERRISVRPVDDGDNVPRQDGEDRRHRVNILDDWATVRRCAA